MTERPVAPGRLSLGAPVGVIDIGSNSVRMVAYEGLSRAPTPLFNDKVMAGLGRGVASTGLLPVEGMAQALAAMRRFRALCDTMGLGRVSVLATAAARDALNGALFLEEAGEIIGHPIELLSGEREAYLSALGVISGFHRVRGLVGDLGGGSLELVGIDGTSVGDGISLKLGGLALQDASERSLKKAAKLVKDGLDQATQLSRLKKGTFFAVGGTWRALAKLHMMQTDYPLHVMHGYEMKAKDAIDFCEILQRSPPETIKGIGAVAAARRPLLAYGALVLEQILRRSEASNIVVSALGVREGLIYEQLSAEERTQDPLLTAAADLNILRSRSPQHGRELAEWVEQFMETRPGGDSTEDARLRIAACLLADIGWRAHPDYRGEQSLNIIAHGAFVGIDHPGRAFLALAVYFRHAGLGDDDVSPRVKKVATDYHLERARLLGALMRVAYPISAAMPGILPRVPLRMRGRQIVLSFPKDLAALSSDRILNRLRQLGKLLSRDVAIEIA